MTTADPIHCFNVELVRDGIHEKFAQLCHAKFSIVLLVVSYSLNTRILLKGRLP